MFELIYSWGGHGGPHQTLEEATRTAMRLLNKSRAHDWIEIRDGGIPCYDPNDRLAVFGQPVRDVYSPAKVREVFSDLHGLITQAIPIVGKAVEYGQVHDCVGMVLKGMRDNIEDLVQNNHV
jgi:hypothetical protein